ncbi:hypothetical protein B0H11DRAFT_2005112 [Mycena galericulata]|nr:hypothetical protein B0H11DRAFT_2005112 [Mycena galericulata]
MSASSLPPIPPNIASLTTPLLLGELLGAYLFGILTIQLYLYHLTFPRDATYLKILVYSVFLLDLASTLMCIGDVYHWFGAGFGNLLAVDDVFLSAFDTPMIGSFLAAIVQCFYCYRLWTLNKRLAPLCILVGLIAGAQAVTGLYAAIVAHIAKTFSNATAKAQPAIYVVFIGAAVADVLIATSMTILLLTSRKTAHGQTSFIIQKIINLTVETNILSSTLAVLTVILLVAFPNTNYFTCPSIILGKIYSNSLFLMLNNRKYMSDTHASNTVNSGSRRMNMSKFRAASKRSDPSSQDISLQDIHISQDTTIITGKGTELV